MINTKTFWLGATERGVKTFFQTFVAVILAQLGAEAVGTTAGVLDADWVTALSVAALALILSLATSIGNANFTAGAPAQTEQGGDKGVSVVVNAGEAPEPVLTSKQWDVLDEADRALGKDDPDGAA